MKRYAEIALVALAVIYLAPRVPVIRDLVKAPAA